MSSQLFAIVEGGSVVVIVFGLAFWQLSTVRRSIVEDRQKHKSDEASER